MATDTTISRCAAKYIGYLIVLDRKGTAKTYGHLLSLWMNWLDKASLKAEDGTAITRDSPMSAVNTVDFVAAYYRFVRAARKDDGTPLNSNTQKQRGHALRGLWTYCCDPIMWQPESQPLTYNAAKSVPMPAKSVVNQRELATGEQVQALLDATSKISNQRQSALAEAVLQTFLTAGIRRSELIGLEVSDYEPVKRTLYVRNAKGGQPRYQRLTSGCCETIDRWLQFRGEFIRGWWKQRPDGHGWEHTADPNAPNYLFTTDRKRQVGEVGVANLFARLRNLAGMPDATHLTPHVLRHFGCTAIYQAKGLAMARQYTGHKDESITWRYIRKPNADEMDVALEEVAMRPGGEPPRPQKKRTKATPTHRSGRRQRQDLRARS